LGTFFVQIPQKMHVFLQIYYSYQNSKHTHAFRHFISVRLGVMPHRHRQWRLSAGNGEMNSYGKQGRRLQQVATAKFHQERDGNGSAENNFRCDKRKEI